MQVYKTCFIIIKKHKATIFVYLGIFMLLTTLLTNTNGGTTAGFKETKTNLAFFSEESTPLTDGLQSFLNKNANIVSIEDDAAVLQDALFFHRVEYIVRIPKGFTQSFLSGGNDVQIEKTNVPSLAGSVYTDGLINKYLETTALYLKASPTTPLAEITKNVENGLAVKSGLIMETTPAPSRQSPFLYYFRYLSYTLLAILLSTVGTIMTAFGAKNLKRRNLCSPTKSLSMNLQLILGNLTFAVGIFGLLIVLGFLIFKQQMLSTQGFILSINALIFTLVCLSIAYLITILVSNPNAQPAVVNVVSLGMCFLSGVFVPQELLGKTVLKISSFTPSFWYVRAVNDISNLNDFTSASLSPVIGSMAIQFGFAALFITISLLVAKQRRMAT